jgi:hypothetical protein
MRVTDAGPRRGEGRKTDVRGPAREDEFESLFRASGRVQWMAIRWVGGDDGGEVCGAPRGAVDRRGQA